MKLKSKMKRTKRLLSGALALAAALSPALAEEPAPEISPLPIQTSTAAPTPEATLAPSSEPSSEPSTEPSSEPSAAPTTAPTAEPTTDPTTEPSSEPSAAPTIDPTAEPTTEPTAEPTIEPSAAPSAEPSLPPQQDALRPESAEATLVDGVYRIPAVGQELGFTWQPVAGAEEYAVELYLLSGDQQQLVENRRVQACRVAFAVQSLLDGRYLLIVRAVPDAPEPVPMELKFELAQGGGQGGFPAGGGGRPGGMTGMSGMTGMPEAGQGFHVTPGEALTSSHASGTKTMQRYGCVTLPAQTEPSTSYAPGDGVEIIASGAFCAQLQGDVLALTSAQDPAGDALEYCLSLRTLELLSRSGVTGVQLDGYALNTSLALHGDAYAALRAQGYVSKDFEIIVCGQELGISAAGKRYAVDESGLLLPLKG